MTKIIGITGLAGSGKDTLAGLLKEHLEGAGCRTELGSFADPIRKIAQRMGLAVYDRDKKELETSIRFAHFELSLCDAVAAELEDYLGEETLCDVYATFATILRARGYVKTERQDVLTISPRKFCQLLGTEAGQKVRKSLWVDILRAKAARCTADYLLLPDVRFPQEEKVCDVVVGVGREGLRPDGHASERGVMDIIRRASFNVHNDGTLADLQINADRIAEEIMEKL